MSDKKDDKKADKKGGDKKPKDDKPKADKKAGDKPAADKKPKDDKPKAEPAPKKADEKAAPAPAADGAAAPAADEKKAKKEKKGKKDEAAAAPAAAADGEKEKEKAPEAELAHFDPNTPVPQPDKAKLESDKKTLEKVIKELEALITKHSAAIELKTAERNKVRAVKNDLFEKGKAMKDGRDVKELEVRKLTNKLDELIAERKNSRQRLDATKASLRFTNLKDLDAAIKATELRIATSTLSLADEKKLIAELKIMKAQRPEILAYSEEAEKVKSANDAKASAHDTTSLRTRRDELRKETHSMFLDERKVFDEFRAKKDADNELKREIDALVAKRKTCLEDKRKFLDSLYTMQREFVKAERAYFKFQQQQRVYKQSQSRASYRDRQREAATAANAAPAAGAASEAPLNMEFQRPHVPTGPRPAAGEGNRRRKAPKEKAADDDKPRKSRKPAVAGPDGEDEPESEEELDMSNFVPFARQKALCDKLVKYLKTLQAAKGIAAAADEKAADAKAADNDAAKLADERNAAFKDKSKGKGAVVVLQSAKAKGLKLEDFFGKDVSKSNIIGKPGAAKPAKAGAAPAAAAAGDVKLVAAVDKKEASRQAAKKQKLTHVPDVFTDFKEIGLSAPAEVGQIEQALKDLVAKKAYFETNPDIEADEAAEAEKAAAEKAAAAPAPAAAAAEEAAAAEKPAEDAKADDAKKGKGKKGKGKKAAAAAAGDDEEADRKKAQADADAAADSEKSRRVAEANADKAAADAEEAKERTRRRSQAAADETAEQKRRVEEAAKADAANADAEKKVRADGRRKSIQLENDEQKRRVEAGEGHHDKPSVIAQVDAAAHGKKAAAPAAKDVAPVDAKKAESAAGAAAPAAELVKKVDAELEKNGFEPFNPSN